MFEFLIRTLDGPFSSLQFLCHLDNRERCLAKRECDSLYSLKPVLAIKTFRRERGVTLYFGDPSFFGLP